MPLTTRLRLHLTHWRDRRRARRAMLWLLRKPEDRLIEDIGLTRAELRQQLGHWID